MDGRELVKLIENGNMSMQVCIETVVRDHEGNVTSRLMVKVTEVVTDEVQNASGHNEPVYAIRFA